MAAVNKNKAISYGGISIAIIIISFYLNNILKFNTLSILFLSSIIIAFNNLKFGVKYGLIVYLATSVVTAILIPNKSLVLLFVMFFGMYTIIKLFIEKKNNLLVEWILKILYFNVILVLTYFILTKLINVSLNNYYKYVYLIIIAFQALFVIYDILLTVIIQWINNKIKTIN